MKEKPACHIRKAPYRGFVAENNCCRLHLHRHAEISYIAKGSQTFIIDDIPHLLNPGDLIIVFPHQLHQLITPEYCKAITSIFDANFVSDYTQQLNNYHIEPCVFHKDELDETTLSALNELAKTGISKSFKMHAVPFLEKGFVSVILADLFSKHELVPYEPTSSAFVLTKFFNYIETHLREDLSLKAVAKALDISPSNLSACITDNTGMTSHALVNSRRLDHARTMLYKTDKPISIIAEEVGFSSERSFYRNFKKTYQKTPLEFRIKKTIAKK